MAAVANIRPEVRAIQAPTPLRELPGWCCWRFESYPGEPKPRKVPLYHTGTRRYGQQGSPQDRAQLTTFSVARDAAARRGFDGVGFALMPEWGVSALDFDNCVAEDGSLPPEIERLVSTTYAEYSPSGKGIRAFVRGNLGNHKSSSGQEGPWGLETFNSTGFVTVTGDVLDVVDLVGHGDTIADADSHIIGLCQRRFGAAVARQSNTEDFTAGYEPVLGLSEAEIQNALDAIDPDVGRDDWVRVGMAHHHEFDGAEDGFALWNEWSSQGSKYPGEEALRQQWDSFERRKGSNRRQVTMASVLKLAREARETASSRTATVAQVQARADTLSSELPVTTGAETPAAFTGKFPVVRASSIMAQKPIDWLIKGFLPKADLGVLFGASGSGKSFVSLDVAFCVARGEDWRGHRVKQGSVVIITAEGGGSYGKRIKAYCDHYGFSVDDVPIGIINAAPNLLEAEDVSELAASLQAMGGAVLLIVDTLAQVTPGANENTSEDMGRAIAHAMVLRRATGAMVLLVHHAGKDLARGARGWSGIKGALDVEIEVSRDEDTNTREIRLSKMKDEEDGLRFGFALEIVTVGMDEDGDEIRSCVAVTADLAPKRGAEGGAKRVGKLRDALREARSCFGLRTLVPIAEMVDATIKLMPEPDEGEPDTRRQHVVRALRQLKADGDTEMGLEAGGMVVFY